MDCSTAIVRVVFVCTLGMILFLDVSKLLHQ